jgi:hypothetical protein
MREYFYGLEEKMKDGNENKIKFGIMVITWCEATSFLVTNGVL